MSKYQIIELKIRGKEILNLDSLKPKELNALKNGNVIYLYRKSKNSKIKYIGQSKHFLKRHSQHYSGIEKKFNKSKFDNVLVVLSSLFNGSALDDVENQLITLFIADNSKSRNQDIGYDTDELINRTSGNYVNDYKEREKIASEVMIPLWENVLYPNGWVKTKTLNELRNKELVKYSPIKTLTEQQVDIITEISDSRSKNYVINGDAGTGKTVLLTHLVAKLLTSNSHTRIAVVVQTNWEKTAKSIFRVFGINHNNLVIGTSTKIINSGENFDIIIVDEAHKLSRRGNKQMASFNQVYQGRFENETNHLDCLNLMTNQLIVMYDVLQAIRPANISRKNFKKATQAFEYKYLTTQFRIQAPEGKSYTSDDYINGIKYLLYKDTGLLEETNFNPNFDREVFRDIDEDAYFGYYTEQPLKNLINWIEEDRNFHPQHINRVLSGLVEPWLMEEGKDKNITHFHEGEIRRRWNSTQENWVNIDEDDAEDQIGSVFAVQGIDLNKVGVLIGNDLKIDSDGKLSVEIDNFHNVNGKFTKDDFTSENEFEFKIFVLNIYYVLLTRGIDGIRIGFWKNEKFKDYMEKTLDIK
ncbi:DUF2075 domain-containing protein [Mammaliicoccus sciuri]|uniref:DUF2075 domain-containing protein n=1 Tax=Mammaliicoccus sciuri TaxID=1296 RepID=UPI00194FC972|nr:DUF2075 domain-containing protein [Mammaliicoccus sciuri]